MKKILLFTFSLSVFVSCAPKIYVIDRPTILETEAGGDWPGLEVKKLTATMKEGPALLPKGNSKKTSDESVLNSEE